MKLVVGLIALSFFVMSTAPAGAQVKDEDEPSWRWPESRWRVAVEKVRAGRRLLPGT
jgi:hypothetical protein